MSGLWSGSPGLWSGNPGLWGGYTGLSGGGGLWGAFGGFSPATLFAMGEQGYWLDPSDFSTMFQDAAGTTPVTATGQSVRLMLDKSKGLVLGPELVTNGDFAVDANWTKGAGWIISGGQASITSAAANSDLTQSISLTVGNTYLVSFTYTASAAFNTWLGSSSGAFVTPSGTGTVARYVVAGAGGDIKFRAGTGVSLVIDNVTVKELPGNHFTQANVANAPILGREPFGGRRNLLTRTEEFNDAAWTPGSVTPTANTVVAPDGSTTADTLAFIANGNARIFQTITTAATPYTFSVWLRAEAPQTLRIGVTLASTGNVSVTTEWQRFSYTFTPSAGSNIIGLQNAIDGLARSVYAWGAQLELGSTATPYQRVGSSFDVTEAGVPDAYYLSYDGSDDFLVSAATINPGAVDKAQVFAGVRKLSDVASGVVCESSLSIATNNGAIRLSAPFGAAANYNFGSKGTAEVNATSPAIFAAAITNVITSLGDISGDSAILRINGTQAASSTADQGTGNYLTYLHYIGRRAGAALPFNGRIYQLITRFGPNLTADVITQAENYVAAATGIYTVDQLNQFTTLDASGVSYLAYAATDASSNNYLVPKTVLAADGTPYSVL
jgi:hypothetical protein